MPTAYQSQDKAKESAFEPLKELVRMVIRGCFHWHKSRPFTVDRLTYRVCINCGARRRFDLNRWKMYGPYFFEPEASRVEDQGLRYPRGINKAGSFFVRAA